MIWICAAIAVVLFFLLIVNIIDMNRFVVRRYDIHSDKIKAPLTVVFLSDLHNKRYGRDNEKLLAKIKELSPDFILCGGDMIVASPGRENKETFTLIKNLSSAYPFYYALGNHEYRADIYPETYGEMYAGFEKQIMECGVRLLRNESVYDEESNITFSGLEIDRKYYKRFRKPFMQQEYIAKLLGDVRQDSFHVVMAHNPEYFRTYAVYGADLSLSGHLHGGIVRLPFVGGCVSPSIRLFPKYSDGLYEFNGKKLIVSCGLGSHTIPVRIFNPGELSVISFVPE